MTMQSSKNTHNSYSIDKFFGFLLSKLARYTTKNFTKKSSNCFICGSKHIIEAITIYVEKLENGILIIKNVPCKKCSQCGEEFFSIATMKEIEKLGKMAEKIISEIMIIDYNKAA